MVISEWIPWCRSSTFMSATIVVVITPAKCALTRCWPANSLSIVCKSSLRADFYTYSGYFVFESLIGSCNTSQNVAYVRTGCYTCTSEILPIKSRNSWTLSHASMVSVIGPFSRYWWANLNAKRYAGWSITEKGFPSIIWVALSDACLSIDVTPSLIQWYNWAFSYTLPSWVVCEVIVLTISWYNTRFGVIISIVFIRRCKGAEIDAKPINMLSICIGISIETILFACLSIIISETRRKTSLSTVSCVKVSIVNCTIAVSWTFLDT